MSGKPRHGHSVARNGDPSLTYAVWQSMIQRCRDVNSKDYPRYGGRGIAVCERWLVFENFLADMGEKPAGRSLDRKENDGPYEPGNCRWATAIEQGLNKSTAKPLTFNGETHSLGEWARRYNIHRHTITYRLSLGWSVERAISTPSRRKRC